MALLVSIENLTITITSTNTTGTGTLTLGQDADFCVPIGVTCKSVSESTHSFNDWVPRVTISGTTVTVTRNAGNDLGTITYEVSIAEFDSTDNTVETGTGTIGSGSSTETVNLVSPVTDLAASALFFGNGSTNTGDLFSNSMCTGEFVDVNDLIFTRVGTSSTTPTRWYVVENLVGDWIVDHASATIASTDESAEANLSITVNMDKTFIVCSQRGTSTNDWRDCVARAELTSDGVVTFTRGNSGAAGANTLPCVVQAIELQGGQTVYRGTITITGTSATDTFAGVSDVDGATIRTPMIHGYGEGNSTAGGDLGSAHAAMRLTAVDTAEGSIVTDVTPDGLFSYEVIDWDLGGGGTDVPLTASFAGVGALTVVTAVDQSIAPTFAGVGALATVFAVDVPLIVAAAGLGTASATFLVEEEVDCYDNTHTSSASPLGFITMLAQSFEGNGGNITRVRVEVQRVNSPTGDMACEIYAHSGTFGTSSVPTGTALATSDNTFAAGSIATSPTEIEFLFDGTFELEDGVRYCVVLSGVTGDITNHVLVSTDNTSPTAPGNFATFTGSWSAVAGTDMIFCVFATPPSNVNLVVTAAGVGTLAVVFAVDVPFSASAAGSGSAAVVFGVDVPLIVTAAGVGTLGVTLEVPATIEVTIPEVERVVATGAMTMEEYMSLLAVWNAALVRIGVAPVTSAPASDGSPTGEVLAASWPLFKEAFLRDSAWDGAKTTAILETFKHDDGVTAVTPTDRWTNVFSLPADHVRSLRLNGRRCAPGYKGGYDGVGMWEEEVAANDVGTRERCLFCEDSAANLEYVFLFDDADITLCPADMRMAMAAAFAAHVARSLGRSGSEMDELKEEADLAMRGARRTDSQTGTKPTVYDTTIADAFL